MNFMEAVSNASQQIKKCASFAVEEINDICKNVGPRPCGEENEKKAQLHIAQSVKDYADTVTREEFDVHPNAFMSFVPIAGACLTASTVCNLISAFKKPKAAVASIGFVGAALTGAVNEFMLYKEFLDPLFKKKTSGNVVAVRKAKGETKRRIIVSGHTDSAPEWTYTYKLGSNGVVTVAGYAVVGLLYSIIASTLSMTLKNRELAKKLSVGQLLFLPAYGMLFFFTNNKRYVPGASDNLSGSYVAASVLKFLSDNDIRFENTEVIALFTGGEECGLRGSKAFFKAHPEMASDDSIETIFAGFDTVRDAEYMMVYNKDMTGMVKNSDDVCKLIKDSAAKHGCDVQIEAIPLGATDAAAASQAGVKAAGFVAMDPAPARYYHTRLDTADNLVPETIEKGIKIALETVFNFDKNGLK